MLNGVGIGVWEPRMVPSQGQGRALRPANDDSQCPQSARRTFENDRGLFHGFSPSQTRAKLCTPTQLIHNHKLYHRQVYEMLSAALLFVEGHSVSRYCRGPPGVAASSQGAMIAPPLAGSSGNFVSAGTGAFSCQGDNNEATDACEKTKDRQMFGLPWNRRHQS
jgi:hypothetical protein